MGKENNLYDFLVDVADAIREKKGTTSLINPQNFSEEILGIEGGGYTPIVERKDVNFYDYDGTLLYSYTSEEAQALTTLPELPTREGLISQCWNYTLEGIANNNYKCEVGVIYDVEPLKESDCYDGTELQINADSADVNYVKLDIDVTDANLMYQICGINCQENKDIMCDVSFGGTFIDPTQNNNVFPIAVNAFRYPDSVIGQDAPPAATYNYNYNRNFGYGKLGKHTIRIIPNQRHIAHNYYLILGNSVEYIPDEWYHPTQGRIYFPYVQHSFLNDGDVNYGAIGYNIFGVDYGWYEEAVNNSYGYYATNGQLFFSEQSQSLYNANIGSSCVELGRYLFSFCSNLKSISLHSGITKIPKGLFYKTNSLKHITIPEGVTVLEENAFEESGIETISLPNSLVTIENNCFLNCKNLKTIIIPSSVTSIGEHAFSGCESLKTIIIPDSVTSIGIECFAYCKNLKTITLSNNMTYIATRMFQYCENLMHLIVPENVTQCLDMAFVRCNSLKTITFLGNVSYVGSNIINNTMSIYKLDFSNCTRIPTLSGNLCRSAPGNVFRIIVPDELYDNWVIATNWVTWASYTVKKSKYTE